MVEISFLVIIWYKSEKIINSFTQPLLHLEKTRTRKVSISSGKFSMQSLTLSITVFFLQTSETQWNLPLYLMVLGFQKCYKDCKKSVIVQLSSRRVFFTKKNEKCPWLKLSGMIFFVGWTHLPQKTFTVGVFWFSLVNWELHARMFYKNNAILHKKTGQLRKKNQFRQLWTNFFSLWLDHSI